jgi:Concanavalin A-like lectin/glucanases superfamily/Pectate lyase superfamily protein
MHYRSLVSCLALVIGAVVCGPAWAATTFYPNPVANWTCDAGSGSSLADGSGYENDGTINGPSWATGIAGKGLSFDGTNDYVSVPDDDSLDITDAVTLSCWVKFTQLGTGRQKVVYKGNNTQTSVNYSLGKYEWANKAEFFFMAGGGTTTRLISSTLLSTGHWYHLAATYDGATARLYINGVQDASTSVTGTLDTNGNVLQLGRIDGGDYLNGVADEIQVYDEALSGDEIAKLAELAPVGRWNLDEASGATAADSSEAGNDGTVSGATWADAKFGKGLSFDGTNDYATMSNPTELNLSSEMTLMAWVKFDTLATGRQKIIYKGNSFQTSVNYSLGKYEWGNKAEFRFTTSGGTVNRLVSTTLLSTGTWYHLAATYDGTTARLYINGTQDTSASASGSIDTVTDSLLIGCIPSADYLDGIIDEVQIFNRAVSANRVSAYASAKNVMDYDAEADGTTDDSRAIQDALTAGAGGIVVIPRGTYAITPTLYVPAGTTVEGRGSSSGTKLLIADDPATDFDLASEFTLSAYVNFDSLASGRQKIIYKGNNSQDSINYSLGKYEWSGKIELLFSINGTVTRLLSTSTLNTSTWYHVAATFDGSTACIYIDGDLDASTSVSGSPDTLSAETLYLGSLRGQADWFDGKLDEVRIYDTALSESDIADLPDDATLVAHWDFDEGAGARIEDATSNANDGVLRNFAAASCWVDDDGTGKAIHFDGSDDHVTVGWQAGGQVFSIDGANVSITGLEIDGNKANLSSTARCVGVEVRDNAQGVFLEDLYIHHCPGTASDGILIRTSGVPTRVSPKRITLRDISAPYNARHGLCVTRVEGLLAQNLTASNNGLCGIDVEPDNQDRDHVSNLRFTDIVTNSNYRCGFLLNDYQSVRLDTITCNSNGDVGMGLNINGGDSTSHGTLLGKNITCDSNGLATGMTLYYCAGIMIESRNDVNGDIELHDVTARYNERGVKIGSMSRVRSFSINGGTISGNKLEGIYVKLGEYDVNDDYTSRLENLTISDNSKDSADTYYGLNIVSTTAGTDSQVLVVDEITAVNDDQAGCYTTSGDTTNITITNITE